MSKKFLVLLESELEKSQIIIAARSQIVDELQDMAEKISVMKVAKLGPIVERIKAEKGLKESQAFSALVSGELGSLLDLIMEAKDHIDTAILELTGDIIGGIEADIEEPEIAEHSAEEAEDAAEEAEDAVESDEAYAEERMKKESKEYQVRGLFETANGLSTKTFAYKSKDVMKKHLNEKCRKVYKISEK